MTHYRDPRVAAYRSSRGITALPEALSRELDEINRAYSLLRQKEAMQRMTGMPEEQADWDADE